MIRKTIKGGNFKSQMVGELVFDQVPEEGSFNPVTSDGVKNSIDDSVGAAKAEMQEKIDEVTLDPSAVALGNVHLLDEVTEFPADGCILIDSETNGARKMSKDKLLELTAQNALAGNVAPAFDPTRTNANPYKAGESVVYTDGKVYTFKVDHYGAWNASDVYSSSVIDFLEKFYAKSKIVYGCLTPVMNSNNWLDVSDCVDNKYINYNTGIVGALTNWCYTETYIPVQRNTLYKTHNARSGNQVCFYDSEKNFVSGLVIEDDSTPFLVPATARYARFSFRIEDKSTFFVTLASASDDVVWDAYDFGGWYVDYSKVVPHYDIQKINDYVSGLSDWYDFVTTPVMDSNNWLDVSDCVEGKYLKYQNGREETSANFCYTRTYIPVQGGVYYKTHNTSSGNQVCFYDKDKTFISGLVVQDDSTPFQIPSNARFARFSFRTADKSTYFITLESASSSVVWDAYDFGGWYVDYKKVYPQPANKEIVVAKDGSGDYSSVTAAVNAASSGDTILVKAGVYDGEKIKASTKKLTIIGEGSWNTIIKNGTNDYRYPTLEMAAGVVKDLQLYMYDGGSPSGHSSGWPGYCIHADYDIMEDNSLLVENCILHTVKGVGAVGMGTRKGCHVLFRHVQFIGEENVAFYMHDSTSSKPTGVQDVRFENCTFSTEYEYVMRLTTQGVSGNTVNLTFVGCVFNDSNDVPVIEKQTAGSGGTMGNLGLLNFWKTNLSYGNNMTDVNYNGL